MEQKMEQKKSVMMDSTIEVHCDVQNVRYAAQYRLGRCSFVLTVSTAHCAALNQL